MQLPKRVEQHITETTSYKIFNNVIPDNWIVREVTERDYGIDCYVEIVNSQNEVTGEMISIQLKGVHGISWTQKNDFTLSGIKISTTNYWNKIQAPVFLFLVDVESREVFYCPVKSEIKRKYADYKLQRSFTYSVNKSKQLTLQSTSAFLKSYYTEREIENFRKELIAFVSNFERYSEFIMNNTGRDSFMEVEYSRILYLTHFYENMKFLYQYLQLTWDVISIEEQQKKSKATFGGDGQMYEREMDEMLCLLEVKMSPLVLKIKDLFWSQEKEYWLMENIILFNVVVNATADGKIESDW